MIGAIVATLFYFGLLFVVIFGWRWALAGITILTGDKAGLHSFGNLCEKDPPPLYPKEPPQYYNYDWKNHWDYDDKR